MNTYTGSSLWLHPMQVQQALPKEFGLRRWNCQSKISRIVTCMNFHHGVLDWYICIAVYALVLDLTWMKCFFCCVNACVSKIIHWTQSLLNSWQWDFGSWIDFFEKTTIATQINSILQHMHTNCDERSTHFFIVTMKNFSERVRYLASCSFSGHAPQSNHQSQRRWQ
jgi:hypothetical protein